MLILRIGTGVLRICGPFQKIEVEVLYFGHLDLRVSGLHEVVVSTARRPAGAGPGTSARPGQGNRCQANL